MSDATIKILANLGWAALVFAIGLAATFVIVKILRRSLKRSKLDPLLQTFFASGIKIIGIVLSVIVALQRLGANTSSLVAVLGVTGAAIALAVKDSLANIAGGLMIVASQTCKAGDYVMLEDYGGYVESIDILKTTLRTFDNRNIEVPNNIMSNSIIVNYSARDIRRIDIDLHIGINEDMRKVEDLLKASASAAPLIMEEPAPYFGIRNITDGYVGVDFFCWCHTKEYWDAYYFMQETVAMALTEAGIKTSAPRMDIEMKKV